VGHGVGIPDSVDVPRIVPVNLVPDRVRNQPGELAGNKSRRIDVHPVAVRNVVHVDQKPNIGRRHPLVLGRTHTLGGPSPGAGHPFRDVQTRYKKLFEISGVVFNTDHSICPEFLHAVQKRRGRRQQIQQSQFGYVQNDRHVNGRVRHVRLVAVHFTPNRQPRTVSSVHIPHSHRVGESPERPRRE